MACWVNNERSQHDMRHAVLTKHCTDMVCGTYISRTPPRAVSLRDTARQGHTPSKEQTRKKWRNDIAVGAIQLLVLPPTENEWRTEIIRYKRGSLCPIKRNCLRRPCRPSCPRRACGHAAAPPMVLTVALVPVTQVATCKPPISRVCGRRARTCC